MNTTQSQRPRLPQNSEVDFAQSTELETSVLGGFIRLETNGDFHGVEKRDFVNDSSRLFFDVMTGLPAVTLTGMIEELKARGVYGQVGAELSALWDDAARTVGGLEAEISKLKELTLRRTVQKKAGLLVDQAAKGDLTDLLKIGDVISEILHQGPTGTALDPLSQLGGYYPSLNDLFLEELPAPEPIVFGVTRGQIGMLNAITNKGKTTFLENACLQLVAGRPWYPFVPELPEDTEARRVVFIDWESTPSEQQKDLATMCRDIPNEARDRFIPIIGPTINEESLNLSLKAHMAHLVAVLRVLKPDVVVIDTVTAAFELFSENDNAEIARKISRPLRHLARVADCAVLASHHLGKPSGKESEIREEAYSGRGGSQFGGFARAVYTIREDKTRGEGYIILTPGKVKGRKFDPVLFRLNFETRWFEQIESAEPVLKQGFATVDEVVAYVRGKGGATTSDIYSAFEGRGEKRTIDERIHKAESTKLIHKSSFKGAWHVRNAQCASNKCAAQTELADCVNEN
jgi:hypothetical protein